MPEKFPSAGEPDTSGAEPAPADDIASAPAANGEDPGGRLQLPPEEHPKDKQKRDKDQQNEASLLSILSFLRPRAGHDFSYYKRATILRRIARRMQVANQENLAGYLDYLRSQPGEAGALLQDLLISVTNFFRDREAFAVLEEKIPELFRGRGPADQVRVWVAGCATGEEAYSIAMLLCEYAARIDNPPQIQVFASDIDEAAIEAAREGSYPETIVADVSEERLRRFFAHEGGRYRVRRSVRESVVFAIHDLLKDSPFSRLDLVSCRNLLIYLNRDAQSRAFDVFHFALREDGLLFLGSSESTEEASALFHPIDKRQRLYQRRAVQVAKRIEPKGVVRHLDEELGLMRSQWCESVKQYETPTEELKASNEELQAMNEELQSINEELTTVNQEFKSKVEQLSRANTDLQNLMTSTNIATVFLDRELRIKRYTPPTVELFNLIPTDIGRPMSDLTHRLEYPEITADAERVLDKLAPVEREVRTSDGRWFLARILPYRTMEDKIAGAVLTCVDITAQKRSDDKTRWLSSIVESSSDAIISYTLDGKIISWNRGAERIFGYKSEEMVGKSKSRITPPDRQEEKERIVETLKGGKEISSFETVRRRKDGQRIDVSISASLIRHDSGEIVGVTAIMQDISARKQALEDLRQTRDELEHRVEQRTEELRERADKLRSLTLELTKSEQRERARMATLLHDHVQQLLVSAKMRVESLRRKAEDTQGQELGVVLSLLDESLESSRTLTGDLSPPILSEGLAPALEWLGEFWMKERHALTVHLDLDREVDADGDEMRTMVFLTVRELLFNVVKHAAVAEAFVTLAAEDAETLCVTVKDAGLGCDPAILGASHPTGSGIGLAAIRERIATMGGRLEIESSEGGGVAVRIHVPRAKAAKD